MNHQMLFPSKEPQSSKVTYWLPPNSGHFSLDPRHSDLALNALVLDQVVGTLVKFGGVGRYEPYLAESWSVSEDKRTYRFKIRPNLKMEDGTLIDAHQYAICLMRLLRLYSLKSAVPVFENILGWDQFKKGLTSKLGITAISIYELEFKFRDNPDGLFEYLSMPYFGIYSPNDFSINGEWKDPDKITSTGAYRVEGLDRDGQSIHLSKRFTWFSHLEKSPKFVTIRQVSLVSPISFGQKLTIIQGSLGNLENSEFFSVVSGTPMILTALSISADLNNFFDNVLNRSIFQSKVNNYMNALPPTGNNVHRSPGFYLTRPFETASPVDSSLHFSRPRKPLKVLIGRLKKNREYVETLIHEIFGKEHLTFEVLDVEHMKPEWLDKLRSRKEYDIFVTSVEIGGDIESWIVEMMFCTKMGVSFEDPSGDICSLTKKYRQQPNSVTKEEYAYEFNKAMVQDATVIPLFHWGQTWYFSKDIDLSQFSPTMGYPRFDLLSVP